MTKCSKPARQRFALWLSLVSVPLWAVGSQAAGVPAPTIQMTQQAASPGSKTTLKVDDAVLIALANHPSLKAAHERIAAQQAVVGQQMAAYYPTISLVNQYRTSQSSTNGGAPNASESYSSQAIFSFILFNFGKRESNVQAARDTLSAVGYNFKTAVDNVVLGVKQAYYTLLGAQAIVKLRQETVKSRELFVRQARGFYEVGTRARIDVVRAESNLYNAQSDLIAAENAVKVGWATLKNAMGVTELAERPLLEGAIITKVPYTLDKARDIAFTTRPELKSFDALRQAQDQNIATARRSHLPDLIFDANYGRRHVSDEVKNGKTLNTFPLQPTWSVGVTLSIPIFDGFRTTNRVEETLHNYYVLTAQEEQERQQVALEVEQSYFRLVDLAESIKADEEAAKAAKENLDLANGRYQVGVGSIIEVTDAQTLYTDAQTTYIRSLYAFKVGEAQLARAMGK
jgi:outer membrane protein